MHDMSSSSSESDEEENRRLKEAAVDIVPVSYPGKSITEKTLSKEHSISTEKSNIPVSANLSFKRDEDNYSNPNTLEVTPEFQNHVSAKLRKLIDRDLKVSTLWQDQNSSAHLNEEGVRLFSSSKTTLQQSSLIPVTPKRKPTVDSSSDSEEDEKFRSIAVSGTDILSAGATVKKFDINNVNSTLLVHTVKSPAKSNKSEKKKKKKKKKALDE